MSKTTKPKYRVLVGMNCRGKRLEPGDTCSDIPEQSVKWLVKRGAIEPAETKESK